MNNGSHRFRAIPLALLRGLFAFGGDRRGNIAAMTALLMVPLVGAMGMAIETADWYLNQRAVQNAADSAALAAGLNNINTTATPANCANTPGTFDCEAKAAAAQYGFIDGQNHVTVTASCTATTTTGKCTVGTCPGGASVCYKVTIQKRLPIALTALVGYHGNTPGSNNVVTISASATSQPGVPASGGGGCMLALSKTAADAVQLGTGGVITLNSCGLSVNSNSSDALDTGTGSSITATSYDVVGNTQKGTGATIKQSGGGTPQLSGGTQTADPYASVAKPSYSGCNSGSDLPLIGGTTIPSGGSRTFNAGSTPFVFCGGLNLGTGSSVTLGPGVYVIDGGLLSGLLGGALTVGTGASLNATGGVTIYLTNGASVSVGTGAAVNIVAPNSGTTSGLAFFEDPSDSSSAVNTFSTGSSVHVTGALYFPGHALSLGTGAAALGTCTQVIADTINAGTGVALNANCTGTGIKPIGGSGGAGSVTKLVL